MPVKQETLNSRLYDELRANGFDPKPLSSKNKVSPVPEADVFELEFKNKSGDESKFWVTVTDSRVLSVYYDDSITDSDEDEWYKVIQRLRRFSVKNSLEWEPKNRDHINPDMEKRTYMKEKATLGEGYYPMGKKTSFSDSVPQVKIILQHTRQIEEGEQRFRNIAKIFVENTNGERFLVPTIRPGVARVYARHVAEGGTPYDDKGKHITSLVEEYTKMAGFVRATRNGQFNESAQQLVNEGVEHYNNLRETLTRMTTHRGYNNYFDNWSPVLNEETIEESNLNELFVQETLDPRIESVMPILARLRKNVTEMEEVKALDEWAEEVINEKLLDPKKKDEKLEEEVKVKYEVVDKDGKHLGTWDGMVFVPYDRSKFPAGKMDKIPLGSRVDKESGPLDSEHMGLSKIGMEEGQVEYFHVIVDGDSKGKFKDLEKAKEMVRAMKKAFPNQKIYVQRKDEMVEEDLDANQKRAGQLGPTEKVGPKGAIGKLVGASESVELDSIKALSGIK